jgi:hypothetical protein
VYLHMRGFGSSSFLTASTPEKRGEERRRKGKGGRDQRQSLVTSVALIELRD